MDSIIRRNINRRIFIPLVAQFVKETVQGRLQATTVRALFQDADRAPDDKQILGPVELTFRRNKHRHCQRRYVKRR